MRLDVPVFPPGADDAMEWAVEREFELRRERLLRPTLTEALASAAENVGLLGRALAGGRERLAARPEIAGIPIVESPLAEPGKLYVVSPGMIDDFRGGEEI